MSRPFINAMPSVSVNVGLSMPYARKTPPLRLERRHADRDGARASEPSVATHACPYCGGRAPDGGHELGEDGLAVCVVKKNRGAW